MMVFLPLELTTDKERFTPQGEKEEVAFRAAIFHASEREPNGGRRDDIMARLVWQAPGNPAVPPRHGQFRHCGKFYGFH